MHRKSYLYVMMAAALAAPMSWAAEDLPKAEAVLDRYIEVTGGKATYEKRKSEVTTIQLEIVGQGIKGTLTRYADESNNSYTTGELEGVGKLEEGVYNGQAWEMNPMMGPRLKKGDENASAVRDSTFHGPVQWRKLYKAEVVGAEKVGEEDAYKVMMTPLNGGKPQSAWYSKKTGYLLRLERTVVSPMGEITVDSRMSDYEKLGSVMGPTKVSQNMMGTQIAVTVAGVKENEEVPANRLEPPAEIKKLMAK
jgi:hypothetical protein